MVVKILLMAFLTMSHYSEPQKIQDFVSTVASTFLQWPLTDGSDFDYIVVGAGAAGSAVAARLALAGADVLLVEAGGEPNLLTKIPGAALGLLGSELHWQYETIPNNLSCLSSQKKQCRFTRGKCLGGSTSINHMLYIRGNRRDFDNFNAPGWTWKELEPYFLIYENLTDLSRLPLSSAPYHNTSGIMKIGLFTDSGNSWHSRIVQGFESLNFPNNADVNADSQIGVSVIVGYVHKGERMSTARAYLKDTEVKRKLKIAKNTRCTNIIIDKNNTARGITVASGILRRQLRLYAKKEVVLCAGAIASPQLLMLSGIGPAEHLKELDIPVRANLPVGQDMSDHVLPIVFILVDKGFGTDFLNPFILLPKGTQAIQWLTTRSGPLASVGLTDIAAFANTLCYDFDKRQLNNSGPECEVPTLEVLKAYIDRNLLRGIEPIVEKTIGLNEKVVKQLSDVNVHNAILVTSLIVLHPKSRGFLRLASTDPFIHPDVYPNYLSDDRDLEEMLRAIAIIEDLVETPIYKKHNASIFHLELEDCPKYEDDRTGYWRCYCRHLTYSGYHAIGTTALGRVVDDRLRVRGIQRLRVGDAGVLPMLPSGNTGAVTIAIGERLSTFILDDNS